MASPRPARRRQLFAQVADAVTGSEGLLGVPERRELGVTVLDWERWADGKRLKLADADPRYLHTVLDTALEVLGPTAWELFSLIDELDAGMLIAIAVDLQERSLRPREAAMWLQYAIDRFGDPHAMYALAHTEGDDDLLERAAEAGHLTAISVKRRCALEARDAEGYQYWLEAGHRAGDRHATIKLAERLQAAGDKKRAVELLTEVVRGADVAAGFDPAAATAAAALAERAAASRKVAEARRWLMLAVAFGYTKAASELAGLERRGRRRALAQAWSTLGAELDELMFDLDEKEVEASRRQAHLDDRAGEDANRYWETLAPEPHTSIAPSASV